MRGQAAHGPPRGPGRSSELPAQLPPMPLLVRRAPAATRHLSTPVGLGSGLARAVRGPSFTSARNSSEVRTAVSLHVLPSIQSRPPLRPWGATEAPHSPENAPGPRGRRLLRPLRPSRSAPPPRGDGGGARGPFKRGPPRPAPSSRRPLVQAGPRLPPPSAAPPGPAPLPSCGGQRLPRLG